MAVTRKRCSALTGLIMDLILLLMLVECRGRIHKLALKNETRFLVQLNTFGFYANGTLDVNVTSLSVSEQQSNYLVGFRLSRSRVSGVLPYTAEETDECPLRFPKSNNFEQLVLFMLKLQEQRVEVIVIGEQDSVLTSRLLETEKRVTREADQPQNEQSKEEDKSATKPLHIVEKKETDKLKKLEQPNPPVEGEPKSSDAGLSTVQLLKRKEFSLALGKVDNSYNFRFKLKIGTLAQGLYNLNFHYCSKRPIPPYSLSVEVTEKNPGGFLSAAELPLSRLYIEMAGVFLTAALVWLYTLMKHRCRVFKIHWLMAALAFTKATSLVFHSINYHFINTEGHPIEGWAVMYYITNLLKGVLLFITLALIGTGWSFDKYILSDKEKKIFMILIPLQVLANVAYIIIESTEEGFSKYSLLKQILFLADLICCGTILFPVVWTLRHLQEASTSTDSKAAVNLEKMKLFRHHYFMIVCYIFFTRIIAILLKITMPFQWQWCYEFLVEMSTLILFVLTGYNFRPASSNPFLQLPQDEDMEKDKKMSEVVTESGALEGISKVKKTSNGHNHQNNSRL